MKDRNYMKYVLDNSNFCNKCDRQVSKRKLRYISVILIILVVGTLSCGGRLYTIFFSGRKQKTEPELTLMLDKCQFLVGTPGEIRATIHCTKDIDGEIKIMDGSNQERAVVPIAGSGSYEVVIPINGESIGAKRLYAKVKNIFSNEVLFYVQPQVTEAQMLKLFQIGKELSNYMKQQKVGEYFDYAALQVAKRWLELDGRVGAVEIYSGSLLYVTNDGLAGSYGLGQVEEGYAGQYTLSEAYEQGKSREYCHIPSRLTLTNTNLVMLSPEVGDGEFDLTRKVSEKALTRLSTSVKGKLRVEKGSDVAQALFTGDYADSGLLFLSTHGNVLHTESGRDMLYFQLGSINSSYIDTMKVGEEGGLWGDINSFFAGDNKSVNPENYRLVFDVSPSNKDEYTVRATTNFIAQGLADKVFDNTVVCFGVCFAAADTELIDLFQRHGATAFIGTKDSFSIWYIAVVMEELVQVLGGNKFEEQTTQYRGLVDAEEMISLENKERFLDTYYRYLADCDNTTYAKVLSDRDNDVIPYTGEDGIKVKISPKMFATRLRERILGLGTDYIAQIYIFHDKNFSMTGTNKFAGKVVTSEGKAIKGAQVTLYRWLDHRFQLQESTWSDDEGYYVCEKVPYGLYVAEARMGDVKNYITLEFSSKAKDTKPIILDLTGIIGTVIDAEGGFPIVGSSVQYTISDSTSSTFSDENGVFCAPHLKAGIYTIVATKKRVRK